MSENTVPLIEEVALSTLRPDPKNTRVHGEKNLAAIKASLARFGQQKPIVVDAEGIIYAGNGTYEAAKALGWKRIAVIRTSLTGAELAAFAVSDNRTAELAGWNHAKLLALLDGIRAEEEGRGGLEALGWSPWDIENLQFLGENATGKLHPDILPPPDFVGVDTRNGRLIVTYENEAERTALATVLGISGDRTIYNVEDLKGTVE